MQPFKYDLPTPGKRKSLLARLAIPGSVLGLVAVTVGVGWAWNHMPHGVAAGSATLPMSGAAVLAQDSAGADKATAAGEARLRAGDTAEAIAQFDKALRLAPGRIKAYQRGLDARAVASKPPAGLNELLPDPAARVTFLLAQATEDGIRRPAAALDDCDQALAIAPADPRVLRARAAALERTDDLKTAIAAYEQALKVLPEDLPLAASLIQLRFRNGDLDKAADEVHARLLPLARKSQDAAVHVGLLEAWIEQGLSQEAVTAQHQAAAPDLAPMQRQLYLAQAYLRYFQEHPRWHRESGKHAVEAAKAVVAPKSGATPDQQLGAIEVMLEALASLSSRQAERGELELARENLDTALALRPQLVARAPRFTARFADLYAQRARLGPEGEAANQAMEDALALVPDHPVRHELARIYANLGVSLLGAKKVPESIKPLERAAALDPTDAGVIALYHHALVETWVKAPLDTVAHTTGISDRGVLLARLLEGYEHHHMSKEAQVAVQAAESLSSAGKDLARAEVLAGEGDRAAARTLMAKVLEKAPTALRWRRLAALERETAVEQKGAAVAALERAREATLHALAMGGDDHDRALLLMVDHERVQAALAAGTYPAARAAATQGLRLDPHNPALNLGLAEAVAHAGDGDGAINACREGLKGVSGPSDAMHAALRERLGSLYRGQKRFVEAIAEYKSGLEGGAHAGAPMAAELTYGLALAHAGNGDREEAINAIRQYVAISTRDPLQAKRVPEVQALEVELSAKRGT